MTNTQHLVSNLEKVATLDKTLWAAYQGSLVNKLPPLFNPIRALSNILKLQRAGHLKWWQNYYVLFVIALVFGISSIFTSYWFLAIYAAILFASAKCRSKYVEAYLYVEIGRPQIAKHAFGLQMPSLMVSGVMGALKDEHVKIDKETLDSVIKLNKASQEFEDVAFGISDAARKGLIGAPYAFALWLFTTTIPIGQHLSQATDALLKNPIFLGILLVYLSGFAFLTYQLAFSNIVTKRDRKRYLLVLNLVREAYQERRK